MRTPIEAGANAIPVKIRVLVTSDVFHPQPGEATWEQRESRLSRCSLAAVSKVDRFPSLQNAAPSLSGPSTQFSFVEIQQTWESKTRFIHPAHPEGPTGSCASEEHRGTAALHQS